MEKTYDESLKADSLSELVLYKIQEMILNKEFQPGDYLPSEKELSEKFGVGKSSVREAVKMLQVLGVVQARQGKGTCIREHISSNIITSLQFSLMLQQNTLEELLEFRKMYDSAFMKMAAQKATGEEKENIRALFKRFEAKYHAGKLTVQDDLEFHYAILETTHNPFIMQIGYMIFEMLRPSFVNSEYYTKEIALTEHKNILEAFLGNDPDNVNKTIYQTLDIKNLEIQNK